MKKLLLILMIFFSATVVAQKNKMIHNPINERVVLGALIPEVKEVILANDKNAKIDWTTDTIGKDIYRVACYCSVAFQYRFYFDLDGICGIYSFAGKAFHCKYELSQIKNRGARKCGDGMYCYSDDMICEIKKNKENFVMTFFFRQK